jgi:protein associated with RNAse G/E
VSKGINNLVTINCRKFDGQIHKRWQATLFRQIGSLLIFIGEFEEEISHPRLGIIRRGTISYEFYWLDCWYNVFRFHEPEGNFRNFYCNINLPPRFDNGVLDYVDLDIDVLVWSDFRFEVLDMDEFNRNCKLFRYTNEIKAKVSESLGDLLKLINERKFPFDLKYHQASPICID